MMTPRDYQLGFHDAILKALGQTDIVGVDLTEKYAALVADLGHNPFPHNEQAAVRSVLGNMATSAGKTIGSALLAQTVTRDLGGRMLFVADREELIQQPVEKFHKACGIVSGIERGPDRAPMGADVVVTSVQTLSRPNRLARYRPDHFDLIIDDECHRNTDKRKVIHDYFETAKVTGITATPQRKNLADLSQWYESVAFELGPFDLVDLGYICRPVPMTVPLDVDISTVRQKDGEFDKGELDTILEPYYRAIAGVIKKYAADRTILAFLPLISSSIAFVRVMLEEGLTAMHCDGSHNDRKGVIEGFERGDFQILANSQVFSTGVDFIRCNCILNLTPLRSKTEWRQRVGRGFRLIPGTIDPGGLILPTKEERRAAIAASAKPDCLILDPLWQTNKIGLAGPGCLIAMTEEDEEAIGEYIRKKREPEDLQEISRRVQRDREEKLRRELAQKAEREAREGARRQTLLDPRQLALELGDSALTAYEPAFGWERNPVSARQRELIESIGVNPDQMTMGFAGKILDATLNRQREGKAPFEAFEALKKKGHEHPEKMTLNDAIRALGENFPMTFGKKYRGVPLYLVPRGFWTWLMYDQKPATRNSRKAVQDRHPAVWRYMTKIVFPPNRAPQPELQPELAL